MTSGKKVRSAKKRTEKSGEKKTPETSSTKELLLGGPKFDDLIPPQRTRWRRRPPVIFD